MMIDFIIKLEDMLNATGHEDWEIIYMPDFDGYILKLDGHAVFMCDAKSLEFEEGEE